MAGIEETFGALLVGVLIGAIFFGVTNLQVYIYFQTYVQDRIWTRATVCYLWVIDALCVAFSFHMMYYYLVICYFDPSGLDTIIWSFKAQAILTSLRFKRKLICQAPTVTSLTNKISWKAVCYEDLGTRFLYWQDLVSTPVSSLNSMVHEAYNLYINGLPERCAIA
ncbi:predicted protein [Postia placenta Mad-698-R]|nr:predicted protein [Postia placenta Mad-698-R]